MSQIVELALRLRGVARRERCDRAAELFEAPVEAKPSPLRKAFSTARPPVVAIVLLLAVWELVHRAEVKPTYALPSPADVGLVLLEQLATAPGSRPSAQASRAAAFASS